MEEFGIKAQETKIKVIIAGSLSVYEEMIELASRLAKIGVECVLPKHFKGYQSSTLIEKIKQDVQNGKTKLSEEDYQKIGKVENWFFDQIKKADLVIVHNKAKKAGETLEGYVGVNTSTDIGCAIAHGTPLILTHDPTDIGLRGLCSIGLIKVMDVNEIVRYLRRREKSAEKAR